MQALVLLTGFLGAGKTTTLRRLGLALSDQGLAVHAVLNDYRNAAIDSATVRDAVASLAPISGSCVCCDSRDELFDALATLPREEPGLVLVEANGGADPAEIVELLSLDPRCAHLAAPVVVSLVHAGRWQKRLLRRGLERDQLRPATHLILSHADEVDEERLNRVRREIGRSNPAVRERTIETLLDELAELARELTGRRAIPRSTPRPEGLSANHRHSAHPFASATLALPDEVDRPGLETFLAALPETVVRAKGLVRLAGDAGSVVVQRTDEGRVDWIPVDAEIDLAPSLVLIGPTLDLELLQESLARHLECPQG